MPPSGSPAAPSRSCRVVRLVPHSTSESTRIHRRPHLLLFAFGSKHTRQQSARRPASARSSAYTAPNESQTSATVCHALRNPGSSLPWAAAKLKLHHNHLPWEKMECRRCASPHNLRAYPSGLCSQFLLTLALGLTMDSVCSGRNGAPIACAKLLGAHK